MPNLYPDDQKKVDAFISTNVNQTERSSFRPLTLLAVIFLTLSGLTWVSYWVALNKGLL